MSDNLAKAIGWSVLLHLLVIAALWFTHPPVKVVMQPKAIEAFVYQPVRPQPKPPEVVVSEPAPVAPSVVETATSEHVIPEPNIIAEPDVVVANPVTTQPTPVAPENLATAPQAAVSQTTTTAVASTSSTNTSMSLAERSLNIATRRNNDISSATLKASQQRPELRDRPATTSKMQITPEHAAANVLMVLSDGSFIEKVGEHCYQAKAGADLRADIFSMKPVPCGEDKNAAMYERIMRKVGQNR